MCKDLLHLAPVVNSTSLISHNSKTLSSLWEIKLKQGEGEPYTPVFKKISCDLEVRFIASGEMVWEAAKLKVIKLVKGEMMAIWSDVVVALTMERIKWISKRFWVDEKAKCSDWLNVEELRMC